MISASPLCNYFNSTISEVPAEADSPGFLAFRIAKNLKPMPWTKPDIRTGARVLDIHLPPSLFLIPFKRAFQEEGLIACDLLF